MNARLIMLTNPILVSYDTLKEGELCYHHSKGLYNAVTDGNYTNQFKVIAGREGLLKLNLSLIAEEIGWVDVEAELKKVYKEFAKDVHQFDAEEYINSAEQFGVLELHKMIFKAAQNEYSEEDLKYAMFQVFKNGCRSPKEGSLSKPKEYDVEFQESDNEIRVVKILKL